MLSFALAAAGSHDGDHFTPIAPDRHSFYRELRPISEEFVPDAVAATGIDRDALLRSGADPAQAMQQASNWISETTSVLAPDGQPVLVAYPLGFDWMFLHWYLVHYTGSSPFGHASALDIKTLYAARAQTTITASTKSQMPADLLSRRPHTHNALDDAIEQAELFANLFAWDGER
jgi:hypothetical protein